MSVRLGVTMVGARWVGSGYPHSTHALAWLVRQPDLEIVDRSFALGRASRPLWGGGPFGRAWRAAARLTKSFALGLAAALASGLRRDPLVYVAYPAVPTLLWWSVLPTWLRPRRVVADAFISWFDTAVNDRGLARTSGWAARSLRWIERRALRCASLVLTDTAANAAHLAQCLALDPARFRSAPLFSCTPEAESVDRVPRPAHPGDVTVLFVGTFVPLHGTDAIAEAMLALRDVPRLRFEIVGDGQAAAAFARRIGGADLRVRWDRGFMSPAELEARIAAADVCLGVFGNTAKAARVWPLKNYLYARMARPIITGSPFSMPGGAGSAPPPGAILVAHGDGIALAHAIRELAADDERRFRLGADSRRHYQAHLSGAAAAAALQRAFADVAQAP